MFELLRLGATTQNLSIRAALKPGSGVIRLVKTTLSLSIAGAKLEPVGISSAALSASSGSLRVHAASRRVEIGRVRQVRVDVSGE